MATADQLAVVLYSQTTLMAQSVESLMTRLVAGFITQLGTSMLSGVESGGPSLIERRFSGDEGTWSEWSLKFRATMMECDVALFQARELAGDSEIEVSKAHVESISMDRPLAKSAIFCNLLIHLRGGPGLEAWRLHQKRYDQRQR